MRAKFINEIRRDMSSGLAGIGIGSTVMCKAYDVCSKLDPRLEQINPLDSESWKFRGALKDFPENMSNVLEVSPSKIVFMKENLISLKVEEYLRVQVFSDKRDSPDWPSKYLKKDEFELEWKPGESTTMHVYTNEIFGASYVFYMDLVGSKIRYYVFRKP